MSHVLTGREAVLSSSIEGTNSTLDEPIVVEETEDGDAAEAVAQVRDYAKALDGLIPRTQVEGPAIFSFDLVQDLRRSVMKGNTAYKDVPGDLPRVVSWIGGAATSPIRPLIPLPTTCRRASRRTWMYFGVQP